MSLNPRSRLLAILRAIDAALHPVRTIRTARARRIAYDLYVPRHAREVTYVLPVSLSSDTEYLSGTPDAYGPAPANYERTDEHALVPLDDLFSPREDEKPVELVDGLPRIGGYVSIGGERVAA